MFLWFHLVCRFRDSDFFMLGFMNMLGYIWFNFELCVGFYMNFMRYAFAIRGSFMFADLGVIKYFHKKFVICSCRVYEKHGLLSLIYVSLFGFYMIFM